MMLISVSLLAQNESSTRNTNHSKDKIMAYQFGNGETSNGIFTFVFDQPIGMEYSVMITPFSSVATLYIQEKTSEGFLIRSSDGSAIEFDFIVFVKKETPPPPQN